jgi:hypothetical protein
MFCGWQLHSSYPALEQLGDGTLRLDILQQTANFDEKTVTNLPVNGVLNAWLKADLRSYNIPSEALRTVILTVQLSFSAVPKASRRTSDHHFAPSGAHLVRPVFVGCDFYCQAEVVTDSRSYTSEYRDYEEWPPGWPKK